MPTTTLRQATEPVIEELGAATAAVEAPRGPHGASDGRSLPRGRFPGKGAHRRQSYLAPTAGCRGVARLLVQPRKQ
jgi:hypothetical protein